MPRSENQKLKLLYLVKFFQEETDENHGLSMAEIIQKLADVEIKAERKAIYQDLELLRSFGMDILTEYSSKEELTEKDAAKVVYKLMSRDFQLPELKLLVDSVQSAKFITEKKSRELIKKLEALVSRHEARQLQRQVMISGRIKSVNESVYYSVDSIHEAIGQDKQIRFQYFQWNLKKEMELRHNGEWYEISPWALVWEDENYYLIGFDSKAGIMKHYRVDKMLHLTRTEKNREGLEYYEKMDLPAYSRSLFGMFGGEEQSVSMICENWTASILFDRFGKDVILVPMDENHFRITLMVSVSSHFFGWLISLGQAVRIVEPVSLVDQMKNMICQLAEQYEIPLQ